MHPLEYVKKGFLYMNEIQPLITPKEAIKLSKLLGFDIFHIVNDIATEFDSTIPADDKEKDDTYYSLLLLATVWNAGRIHGIREERKKKQ